MHPALVFCPTRVPFTYLSLELLKKHAYWQLPLTRSAHLTDDRMNLAHYAVNMMTSGIRIRPS